MISYPQVGYYWAPAGAEQLALASIAKKPSSSGNIIPRISQVKKGLRTIQILEGHGQTIAYARAAAIKNSTPLGLNIVKSTRFALYNAHNNGTSDKKDNSKVVLATRLREHAHMLQDSGGFQLFSGASDFVDPVEVAKSHNIFADSGVALELPVSLVDSPEVVTASAYMMAANSETILKEKTGDWHLMNVSHGMTPALRLLWQKTALKNPLDSLCIAGLRGSIDAQANGTSALSIASHMLTAMLAHPYKHYHLLGMSTPVGMMLASLAAALHQKVITSDSTTWLSGQQFKRMIIPGQSKNAFSSASYMERAPCTCMVCSAVEYSVWLDKLPSLISLHNAVTFSDMAAASNKLAKFCLESKFSAREIVSHYVGYGFIQASPELEEAVKLVLKATTAEQAAAGDRQRAKRGTLFATTVKSGKDRYARQVKVIQTYEKYHKKKFFKG